MLKGAGVGGLHSMFADGVRRASLLLEKVALQHSMSREAGEVVGYRRESKPSALSPYKDKGTAALNRKEL